MKAASKKLTQNFSALELKRLRGKVKNSTLGWIDVNKEMAGWKDGCKWKVFF